MENFEVMLSEKGKRLLVVNNFKFKFGRLLKSGETYWRCTKNTCKCSVYTVENDTVIIKSNLQHNHEDAPEKLNRQRISNTVKRKAIEDCNEKPSKLIRQEISTAKHILTVADIALIRRNLYNAKRTVIPPLPNSIDEVHDFLSSIIVETNKSESFLLVNEKEKNIIIFACETNLKLLCSCDVVYMDGTFTYCTKFFCQLFTIHGLKNNNYVPLVFCLLKSKHQATYFYTLLTLVECCAEKGLTFKPQKVVIDFELAIHNALKQIWPDLSIIGCRFHLSQSWWRYIQKVGLTTEYKDNTSEIGRWCRYLFGLSFLHPDDVSDCFAIDFASFKPTDERIEKLSDFLVDTYISVDATFPPEIWADASECSTRTTNACESFHSKFNQSFYQHHPNIHHFVEVLKQFQIDIYIKIDTVHQIRRKSRLDKQRQIVLKEKINQYNDKIISPIQFVKCISYLYKV